MKSLLKASRYALIIMLFVYIYGILIPAMLSAPNTLLVFLGVFLGFLFPAWVVIKFVESQNQALVELAEKEKALDEILKTQNNKGTKL